MLEGYLIFMPSMDRHNSSLGSISSSIGRVDSHIDNAVGEYVTLCTQRITQSRTVSLNNVILIRFRLRCRVTFYLRMPKRLETRRSILCSSLFSYEIKHLCDHLAAEA